ncbi:MAG: hypothetical protein M3R68_05640 [Acidobacteriota bacterium]|nr:hypothetical protein [Acidobacteriota bacterium]
MSKLITYFLATAALVLSTAAVAAAQTEPVTTTKTTTTTVKNPDGTAQVTKTIQKSDGTYTIIEYPVGKEVNLTLDPIALAGATGTATVLRDPTGTTIKLNLTGLPADMTSLNLYAVDPEGTTTLLGPIDIDHGVATLTTTTPMDKFMLIASPESTLSTYAPDTKVYFRSAVPQGFAVVPFSSHPRGEQVSATTTSGEVAASAYTVPMLNIPAYKKGDETKLKISFSGDMAGARANVFLDPHKDGRTDVNFRFHELKEAPAGKTYTVWAVSPDNKFTKVGQIVNTGGHNEAEIKSQVALRDFGLLVTMEDANGTNSPIGPRVGWVEIIRTN